MGERSPAPDDKYGLPRRWMITGMRSAIAALPETAAAGGLPTDEPGAWLGGQGPGIFPRKGCGLSSADAAETIPDYHEDAFTLVKYLDIMRFLHYAARLIVPQRR